MVLSGLAAPLPPMWDLHGRLWVVDRRPDGARVFLVREGRPRILRVPGVTGEDVASAALSRDGTRLAVEVEGPRDRLRIARVARTGSGRVEEVAEADEVSLRGLGVREIRDLGWPSPGSVALLTAPGSDTSQVVAVDVDGSTSPTDATAGAEVFAGRADELVSSPSPGTAVYLCTPSDRIAELAANGRWTGASIPRGLRSPTYVG